MVVDIWIAILFNSLCQNALWWSQLHCARMLYGEVNCIVPECFLVKSKLSSLFEYVWPEVRFVSFYALLWTGHDVYEHSLSVYLYATGTTLSCIRMYPRAWTISFTPLCFCRSEEVLTTWRRCRRKSNITHTEMKTKYVVDSYVK